MPPTVPSSSRLRFKSSYEQEGVIFIYSYTVLTYLFKRTQYLNKFRPNMSHIDCTMRAQEKTALRRTGRPLDGQCYCLELILRNIFLPRWLSIIVQYFTSRVCYE
jgi:hypothetical protein